VGSVGDVWKCAKNVSMDMHCASCCHCSALMARWTESVQQVIESTSWRR